MKEIFMWAFVIRVRDIMDYHFVHHTGRVFAVTLFFSIVVSAAIILAVF